MTRRPSLGAVLAAAAIPAILPALAWAAPSAYGCERLDEASPGSFVEGLDGVFFRLANDLRLMHPISDGSVAATARLSRALAARGTTLVYVPLPSKGLAMPRSLPPEAADFGFDHDLAVQVYQDEVARLRAAGVVAVDALTPLLELPAGELAFIPVDHHWTSAGSRAVAGEVARTIAATPGYGDLAPKAFETRPLGYEEIPSPLRREVQALCRSSLPPSGSEAFETVPVEAGGDAAASGDIFAAEATGPDVVLVGTSMSRTPAFNFGGFVAEAASLDVVNYAMIGGNQYGSMAAYLLSEDFLAAPPRYIIWENPIYNNLAQYGEQPMREFVAAVVDDCVMLDAERVGPDTLGAALPEGTLQGTDSIRADAGAAPGLAANFDLTTPDGAKVSATIRRSDRQEPTRRFYQFVEPLWEPGISRVEVRFDRAVGDDATLAVCTDQETPS